MAEIKVARLSNTKTFTIIGELIEDDELYSLDSNGNLRAGVFVEEDSVFYFKPVANPNASALTWNDVMALGTWGNIVSEHWNFTFNEYLKIACHEFIEIDSIT